MNDRSPRPDRVWNRIPDGVRQRIIQLALDEPAQHNKAGLRAFLVVRPGVTQSLLNLMPQLANVRQLTITDIYVQMRAGIEWRVSETVGMMRTSACRQSSFPSCVSISCSTAL